VTNQAAASPATATAAGDRVNLGLAIVAILAIAG
jgi:hypothetical protein